MANVTVYSTPSCVYCKMAKKFFQDNDIEYKEHNVQEDMEAQKEMLEKSKQMGVPVIDIDGEIFVGFDKDAIAKALNIS